MEANGGLKNDGPEIHSPNPDKHLGDCNQSHPHPGGRQDRDASCKLLPAGTKYVTIERECLVIRWVVDHF
ncbi:hypothetical protein Y1Q_0005320 [Alligator mississippiensis]|uniref:Uncharacterized protein n=1 Tax=Alligator mississippiensis TaxID=8496 RepID=A0A151MVJ7_ALLMI|nr:hypothetical protein Y1Q_0005320 [Alligator mississippiensis]